MLTNANSFFLSSYWQTSDMTEIAQLIVQELSVHKDRLVVITQRRDSVIVASKDTQVKHYDVVRVPDNEVVDTNSAGDAFVGGFFAQYVQDQPIDVCIKCATFAAQEVIKQNGCNFPKQNNFQR